MHNQLEVNILCRLDILISYITTIFSANLNVTFVQSKCSNNIYSNAKIYQISFDFDLN